MRADLSSLDFQVLSILDSDAPAGARTVAHELEQIGIAVSEATAARLLTKCDERGFSKKVGRRGRNLTAAGKECLEDARFRLRAGEQLSDALDIRSATQLLDLLHMRRATETEAAILAARRATDEDLAKLQKEVDNYSFWAENPSPEVTGVSYSFHQLIVEASHSPLLISIYSMIEPRISALAPALKIISTMDNEPQSGPQEHAAILDAIRSQDSEAAATAIAGHLNHFIDDVTHFVDVNDPLLVARLLAFEQGKSN